ncbi:PspA/IM30 family protein [Bacillus cereus group sp. BfR-BA-01363]|uniref:PspA/IM30 family protein n=1 Tax=unclassified Bacillus cereus group TaxID=2750818 RepID=UPI001F59DE37|nr:PspA/IM30 family protein [Bacillus cereus group sp. BfR-BA-01363]MDX5853436.1 PspA/IM30 family protein [Bacillus cereus group sp. BfR-BA-01363]
MGLVTRFKNVCKGYFNKWLTKAEDPEVMLEQLIAESKTKYEKVQIETAKAISSRAMVAKDYEAQLKKRDDLVAKAKASIKAGNDKLATDFLEQKKDEEEILQEIKLSLETAERQEESLKDELKRLTKVMKKAETKKQLLIAKNNRAQAQKTAQEIRHDLDGGNTLTEIGKIERKIDEKESLISANEDVHSIITKSDVEREFEEIKANEVSEEIQTELETLKAQMASEESKEVALTKEA